MREQQNPDPAELYVDERVVSEFKNFREEDREYLEGPTTWWRVPVTYDFVPFTQFAELFRAIRGFLLIFMFAFFVQHTMQKRAGDAVKKLTGYARLTQQGTAQSRPTKPRRLASARTRLAPRTR